MAENYSSMHQNVRLLGTILGETIRHDLGKQAFSQIETIRKLSKSFGCSSKQQQQLLINSIENLADDELLPIAKGFNQLLSFENAAEQYYNISAKGEVAQTSAILANLFEKFNHNKVSKAEIEQAINKLQIEIVLTAHPTEVTRRTLAHKLIEINNCLAQLDHDDLSVDEQNRIMRRLRQLVAQYWYTDEIRKQRPSPIDEAKHGLAIIENSLWEAVPEFLRDLNDQLVAAIAKQLPLTATPIVFSSWIGSDRDGNPYVTAAVTEQVILLGRLKACELFLKDIQLLVSELSMTTATAELIALAGGAEQEPYRVIVKQLRSRLRDSYAYLERRVNGEQLAEPDSLLRNNAELKTPLLACYHSLKDCGMAMIANGQLLDTLRRIDCFGLQLLRLDMRQESSLHSAALTEITQELNLGAYSSWSEKKKQQFLIAELNSNRPLLPLQWQPSAMTQEILQSCKVIAQAPEQTFSCYIISMAAQPSDVLAVQLLLKACGCRQQLPVCPLFETLEDLNRANQVIQQLIKLDWYRQFIANYQMVMIGYSDSSKDAGVLAASWAQYKAQEKLINSCNAAGIKLMLFHGRGGTIGRGGAPAHAALLSQPPGSLEHGLRVTEQGEMIRFKFGLPKLASISLALYTSAILEANLLPPPLPKQHWRRLMNQIAQTSCQAYRAVVQDEPNFLAYFRSATPEQELRKLPLGSRPARRRPGGIETLRAIPWIFAWSQNRLMLPAWLGAEDGLQQAIDQGHQTTLAHMYRQWPFFHARISMLEMVFAKTDIEINQYYEQRLVAPQLWPLGQQLRAKLQQAIAVTASLTGDKRFNQEQPWIAESIALRSTYTAPLNILQVELLTRLRRQSQPEPQIEQALMVTIAGIAAGLRNTG